MIARKAASSAPRSSGGRTPLRLNRPVRTRRAAAAAGKPVVRAMDEIARGPVPPVEEVVLDALRPARGFALDDDPHDRELVVLLVEEPLPEKDGRSEVEGPDLAAPDVDLGGVEKAAVAQGLDALDVTRIAERLLDHVGDLHRREKRPEPVGVEGLERADLGEVQVLDVGQGRLDDEVAVLDVAGRPDVLLDDVGRREGGLVFEGEFTAEREPADVAGEALDRHPGGVVAEDHVAHARGDAAVDDGGDAGLPRGFVEGQRVLGKERDVDHVLAGGDDLAQGGEAHEAGDGADDEVAGADDGPKGGRRREVGLEGLDGRALELGQVVGADVDRGDLEFARKVERDDAADHARAEHDDLSSWELLSRRWSRKGSYNPGRADFQLNSGRIPRRRRPGRRRCRRACGARWSRPCSG